MGCLDGAELVKTRCRAWLHLPGDGSGRQLPASCVTVVSVCPPPARFCTAGFARQRMRRVDKMTAAATFSCMAVAASLVMAAAHIVPSAGECPVVPPLKRSGGCCTDTCL